MYCVLHFKIKLLDFKSSLNTKRMLISPLYGSGMEWKNLVLKAHLNSNPLVPEELVKQGNKLRDEPRRTTVPTCSWKLYCRTPLHQSHGFTEFQAPRCSVSLQQPFKHKAVLVIEIISQPIKKSDLNLLIMTLISHSILNIFNLLPTDNPSGKIQYHS